MKIAILEDERVSARRLSRMIKEIIPNEVIIKLYITTDDALSDFHNELPDLIFLDLNLNGEDGFSILKELGDLSSRTIVVSANTDRAIEAFELGVIDFIPKPFDKERLQIALNRFTGKKNRLEGTSMIVIKNQGSRKFIPITDIISISGAGDYSEVKLTNGETYLYSKSLDTIEKQFPENFKRIHKSHIIDMNRVTEVKVQGGGKYLALLDNNSSYPISRTKYKVLFSS